MFSKQLPLLERSKQSVSPTYHNHNHSLQVHGEHQCGKLCMDPSVDDQLNITAENAHEKDDAIDGKPSRFIPVRQARGRLEKGTFGTKMSQSVIPKTTDINQQSETMLPQIQITNKRLTQIVPPIGRTRERERRQRQFVLKPELITTKEMQREHDTNTDGVDTDGGSVEPIDLTQSKDSSQGGFTVLKNGQIAMKQKRILEQLPLMSGRHHSPYSRLAPLPTIPKV